MKITKKRRTKGSEMNGSDLRYNKDVIFISLLIPTSTPCLYLYLCFYHQSHLPHAIRSHLLPTWQAT